MQDNVTQTALADEMLQCDMWQGGILVPIDLATRIRNRLASTAQPEVKGLVEALEDAIGLLWEHCEGITPRIEPLERALAAYREAQT
jgi:hypothetical protein